MIVCKREGSMDGYLVLAGVVLVFIALIALFTGPAKIETHTIHMHQSPQQYERNDRAAAQERGERYNPGYGRVDMQERNRAPWGLSLIPL